MRRIVLGVGLLLLLAASAEAAPGWDEARALAAAGKRKAALAAGRVALAAADDAAHRCELATWYASARRPTAGDLAIAAVLLPDCEASTLSAELATAVDAATGKLALLDDSALSPIEIITEPAGARVTLSGSAATAAGLADLPFTAPRRVWLPAGSYAMTARLDGHLDARGELEVTNGRGLVMLHLTPIEARRRPGATEVDFSDDGGGGGELVEGAPPAVKHASLLPDRYRKGIERREEPIMVLTPVPPRILIGGHFKWLLSRILHDGVDSREGVAVGGEVRIPLAARLALETGLGWQRRGARRDADTASEVDLALDVLTVPARLRVVVAEPSELEISVGVGLAATIALDDHVGDAAVARLGVDVGAVASLEFPWLGLGVDLGVDLGLRDVGDGELAGRAFLLSTGLHILL